MLTDNQKNLIFNLADLFYYTYKNVSWNNTNFYAEKFLLLCSLGAYRDLMRLVRLLSSLNINIYIAKKFLKGVCLNLKLNSK